jgi:hypothetical protein
MLGYGIERGINLLREIKAARQDKKYSKADVKYVRTAFFLSRTSDRISVSKTAR